MHAPTTRQKCVRRESNPGLGNSDGLLEKKLLLAMPNFTTKPQTHTSYLLEVCCAS